MNRAVSYCRVFFFAMLAVGGNDCWSQTASPRTTLALCAHPNGFLFAGTSTQIFRSTDDGSSWRVVLEADADAIVVAWDGSVFAATSLGIQRSTDFGSSWFDANGSIPGPGGFALEMGPDSAMYSGGWGRVYRSTDFGASWNQFGNQFSFDLVDAIAFSSDSVMFAGAIGIWRRVGSGTGSRVLAGQNIRSFQPVHDGIILAGTQDAGIFRSTDDGLTWSLSNAGFQGTYVPDLVMLSDGTILAASFNRGVYRSTDAGATWLQSNSGLSDTTVYPFMALGDGSVLVGTDAQGIFASADNGVSWIPFDGATDVLQEAGPFPSDPSLGPCYPNPFNPATTISYHLPRSSRVRLTVHDLSGREIATLIDAYEERGYKSVRLDGSALSSGIYFCRLQVGVFSAVEKFVLLR